MKEERKKESKKASKKTRKKESKNASKKTRKNESTHKSKQESKRKAGKYERTIGLLQYIHTPELTISPPPAQGQDKNAQFWTMYMYISQSTFQMLGQFSNAVATTIHVVQCTYHSTGGSSLQCVEVVH